MSHGRSTMEIVAQSQAKCLLGMYGEAISILNSALQEDYAIALSRFDTYIAQRDYGSAIESLETALPARDEPDLADLGATFLWLQAAAFKHMSILQRLQDADACAVQLVQNLRSWALGEASSRPQASEGKHNADEDEVLCVLTEVEIGKQFDEWYSSPGCWSDEDVQQYLPQIEFVYWSVHLMSIAISNKRQSGHDTMSTGFARLRHLAELFLRRGRTFDAAAVAENYCYILAADSSLNDDAFQKELATITHDFLSLGDKDPPVLAMKGNMYITLATVCHQYVCDRGSEKLSRMRDQACETAFGLYDLCQHVVGKLTVSYLRCYEYGRRASLQELESIADQYEELNDYGRQMQVLKLREKIAVTLRDYPAHQETVNRIEALARRTGVLFSKSQYIYEPGMQELYADQGKILEGGEAAMKVLLEQAIPGDGDEASLCEALANANFHNLGRRRTYLERMLHASTRDDQPFLMSYAAAELAHLDLGLFESNVAPDVRGSLSSLEHFLCGWIMKDIQREDWHSLCKKYALLARLAYFYPRSKISHQQAISRSMDCLEDLDLGEGRHNATMMYLVETIVYPCSHAPRDKFPDPATFDKASKAWEWALSLVSHTVYHADVLLRIASLHIHRHRCYPTREGQLLDDAMKRVEEAKEVLESWDLPHLRWRAFMLAFLVWQARIKPAESFTKPAFYGLTELEGADTLLSDMRSELSALEGLRALLQKQRFVADRSSHISKLAIRICDHYFHSSTDLSWSWIQRSKARSLSDLLGESTKFVVDDNSLNAEAQDCLQRRKDIILDIQMSKPERRFTKRKKLEDLHREMELMPELRDIIDVWEGRPFKLHSLSLLSAESETSVTFVDWVQVDNTFRMSTVRAGEAPQYHRINITASAVTEWISLHLNTNDLTNRRAKKWLQELMPLIAPLVTCTTVDELLVLSPTGNLHALPLHALGLADSTTLLERNPVIYSSSLSILRASISRRQEQLLPKVPSVALFGNPSKDRQGGTESVTEISKLFETQAKVGDDATVEAFLADGQLADFIHFHGHAYTKRRSTSPNKPEEAVFLSSLLSSSFPPSVADDATPLDDSIEFANKTYLTAREICDLKLRGHVSLIACGSGEQTISVGDEPSGLITALLIAGASSVLGTLWPIADEDGLDFSKLFYEKLFENSQGSAILNLASSLRYAILTMRERKGKAQVFHWGAFVLHGAWQWKRTTQDFPPPRLPLRHLISPVLGGSRVSIHESA